MSTKVVIQGAAGRMGKMLIRYIQEEKVSNLLEHLHPKGYTFQRA